MSFDQLTKDSVSKKREEIVINSGGKKLVFYANELTITQRIRLKTLNDQGGDTFLYWVVFSIVDQDGKHMSIEQAEALSDDVMDKFLSAAMNVSSVGEVKKKGKRAKTRVK